MSEKSSDLELEHGGGGDHQQPNSRAKSPGNENGRHRLPFRVWVAERMSWSWFTCTQSTGGIAALLSLCPKRFDGLDTIGTVIFIFNIVLFALFTALMILRWTANPSRIKLCFTTPPECFFFGSYWLSAATMIINAQRFGVPHTGPWLIVALRVLFWMYCAISLCVTVLHTVVIAKAAPIKALEFSPAMIVLILSAMLTGTVAESIAKSQPLEYIVSIMVAGVAYQGLGWIVCMVFITLTIATVLEKGWPPANLRTGLFILVGTSGFTIVALIGVARAAPTGYGYFAAHPMAHEILLVSATWVGIFLWLFSFWSFAFAFVITVAEVFVRKEGKWILNIQFTNTAWAAIFPNVGWAISTIYLGEELQSEGILWVSVAMIIFLVAAWLLNLFLMAKAVFKSLYIDSRIKLS